jgi:SAM-dependent methyltransferase
MSVKNRILESPLGYALWSSSFIGAKVRAIRSVLRGVNRPGGTFLDIGCGPGSNSPFFGHDYDYLGVDINPAYIATARRKFPSMKFAVGDATRLELTGRKNDIVLINSLIHHLDDEGALSLLTALHGQLNADGVVVVQEPLIPDAGEWFMRLTRRMDRGAHFRTLEHWRQLYRQSGYSLALEEFYQIKLFGIAGWKMHSVLLRPAR